MILVLKSFIKNVEKWNLLWLFVKHSMIKLSVHILLKNIIFQVVR